MNNVNIDNFDNEIDLKEIFLALWSKKILITVITTLSAIFSVLYSFSLPNIYTSDSLLAPTSAKESLSSKLEGYSSLAGIAGINLPTESGSKSEEALARIKSYDFFVNQFLPNIALENLVAAKSWIQSSNTIIYDNKIYDNTNKKWVRVAKHPMTAMPSNQEAFKTYNEIITIAEDPKTSFVSISIDHVSPYIAKKWLNIIIHNINNHMREIDKLIAENSINFLNKSAQKTNLSEIKGAISKLLESQIQALMLVEASKDYVFKPIRSPIAPENKSKPSRGLIAILGTFLGFIISIFMSLYLYYFNSKKI